MGSFTCRDDARPAADDPTARDADSRRWQEVRRAVQEAKQLGGIYSMKIRGVTIVLKQDKSQRSSKASADDQPVRKELTARQMRSKERKDAFHAKKRGESAGLPVPAPAPPALEAPGAWRRPLVLVPSRTPASDKAANNELGKAGKRDAAIAAKEEERRCVCHCLAPAHLHV